MTKKQHENIIGILESIGEDMGRDGLAATPERVIASYQHLFAGYNIDKQELLGRLISYHAMTKEFITIDKIPFMSMCEHHMLPFFGDISIVYQPKSHILGIGRIKKYVQIISRKLTLQEHLTQEIAQDLYKVLKPKSLEIILKARHLCMEIEQPKCEGEIITTKITL